MVNPLAPQPAPQSVSQVEIGQLVLQDVQTRIAQGIARYGVPLRPFNGRDALLDAYQEAMDLLFYLRQAIEEARYA